MFFQGELTCNFCFRREVRLFAGGRREALLRKLKVSWPLDRYLLENERLQCELSNRLANHRQTCFRELMTTLRLRIMR